MNQHPIVLFGGHYRWNLVAVECAFSMKCMVVLTMNVSKVNCWYVSVIETQHGDAWLIGSICYRRGLHHLMLHLHFYFPPKDNDVEGRMG